MVLRRARSITGGIGRGGPWKLRLFWALYGYERSECHLLFAICYFCSMERSYELFSLLWNGLERDSESLLLFLYYGFSLFLFCGMVPTGTPKVFCSAKYPEFYRNKVFVLSIPSFLEVFFSGNFQLYLCKSNFNLNYPSKKL